MQTQGPDACEALVLYARRCMVHNMKRAPRYYPPHRRYVAECPYFFRCAVRAVACVLPLPCESPVPGHWRLLPEETL